MTLKNLLGDIALDSSVKDLAVILLEIKESLNLINAQIISNQNIVPLIEYDNNGKIIYLGHSIPGSLKSDPVWRIQKFNYNSSGNLTDIKYANGENTFINIWDNRQSITYI